MTADAIAAGINWPGDAFALPADVTRALVASALAYRGQSSGRWAECAPDAPGGSSWVTGDADGWLAPLPAFRAWCRAGRNAGNVEAFYSEWPADEAAIASAELEAACYVFDAVRAAREVTR